MKFINTIVVAIALAFASISFAKPADEPSGTVVTLPVYLGSSSAYTCGEWDSVTAPLMCPGIPITLPDGTLGSVFVYIGAPSDPTSKNVSLILDALDFGSIKVTSYVLSIADGTFDVNFKGVTTDGDNDQFTGVAHFTGYTYQKSSGGGRGSHNTLTILVCTGGTITITYK